MKSALKWCAIPLLVVSVVAQDAPKPKKAPAKSARTTVTLQDVQELRNALAAQQQQIQQLMQQMQSRDAALQQAQQQTQAAQQQLQAAQTAAAEAQQKAAAAESAASGQSDTVAKLSSQMADVQTTLTNNAVSTQEDQKRFAALEGLVGRFRFNGDIRVRGESFFQNCVKCVDRNRARIRVRFGFDGKLNEDFTAGLSLATGALGDPTSTNTTFSNFFEKHTIGLDRGYITYNPQVAKWFSVTGGKFAYNWQRTSVTFDSDLNPEGFSEKLSWDLRYPLVKNFTVQAHQLMFNEVSGGTDSYAIGGQASAKVQYGPWTATPSFSLMKWNNTSAILQASAFAVGATTTGSSGTPPAGPFPVPGEGPGCAKGSGGPLPLPSFAPCAFAPNGMTNAVLFDASGKPRFWSGFFYADFILNNQIKTGIARLPLNAILEYEDNLDAASHPLDPLGNIRTDLGSQSHAYLVDVSLGQTKNKNDIQFGYAFARQEQDSVIASFNESDQRAPTNILQHRFYALWKLRANTVASFTWWHGRTLNPFLENAVVASGVTVAPGQTEPSLNRLQFDLIYTF
jgi:hypothetical protein